MKQNRGSQGEGVWVVRLARGSEALYRGNTSLALETPLVLTEAVDNHEEASTLGDFLTFAERYLEGGAEMGAQIIDPVSYTHLTLPTTPYV